ncbi:hypothetical protein ESA94_20435 [Lacibacter luteus]|uniref:SseB protein N-terminal domain-containing protein n=1 Tax=Lacibacter luteus TaxID=2508719 RepID=A0A4Q1CDL0_9BACT|nr:hypothetical protein [Lacibacter luteus]RXK57569.1 hypothetical protein ESA94_20435 [Lacibacter luteus]
MFQTNTNKSTIKEIRERERKEKEDLIKSKCEELAIQKLGSKEALVQLSNKYKGLWYLPILDENEEEIIKLLILKPIDRHILSYASTKIEDEGLYIFLEAAMNECVIKEHSDMDVITEDEYFIPAANKFNKILEGKKAFMVKR